MMNRRTLLNTAALAVSLGACSSNGTVNTTQAVTDANIVVSGISADYKAFLTLYPTAVPVSKQSEVEAALAAAQAALTQLSGASTATGLQAVETDINLVLGVLSTACQPSPGTQSICPQSVSAGLLAANVLLPLIEVTINQLQGVPPKVAAAARPGMSPEQARLVLTAAAK